MPITYGSVCSGIEAARPLPTENQTCLAAEGWAYDGDEAWSSPRCSMRFASRSENLYLI